MPRVILDVSFHKPRADGNAGGWIVPKLSRQTSCGQLHISPHFESLAEVERQIDRMKADLEEIRAIARQEFASAAGADVQAAAKAIGIVDDDEGMRNSYKFLFQTAGHYVETFASPGDFLKADPTKFACLILDQFMPGMSGLQLAEQLRAQGHAMPIMLVTSAPSPAIVKRAAELGINRVLEKTPDIDDLLAFVSAPNRAPDMQNALCLRWHGRDGKGRQAASMKSRGSLSVVRPGAGTTRYHSA